MIGAVALAVASGLGGCSSRADDAALEALFQADRAAALADPGPVPADWQPDVVVHLSPLAVDRAVATQLGRLAPVERELVVAGATLRPRLRVDGAHVVGEGTCEGCLVARLELGGVVGYAVGPVGGEAPVALVATLDVAVATDRVADRFVVTAQPVDVRRVALGPTGLPLPAKLVAAAEEQLRLYVLAEVQQMPPRTLLAFDAADVPLRALRVEPEGQGLAVVALSAAPSPGVVRARTRPFATDWSADVSLDSVVALARREAFARGPLGYDVVAVPASFALADDGAFTADVRLWRTASPWWWRDLRVSGAVSIAPDGGEGDGDGEGPSIAVVPIEVTEIGRSARAVAADPLAALAQAPLRATIGRALERTLPATIEAGGAGAGGARARVTLDSVSGGARRVTVAGGLALQPQPPPRPDAGR